MSEEKKKDESKEYYWDASNDELLKRIEGGYLGWIETLNAVRELGERRELRAVPRLVEMLWEVVVGHMYTAQSDEPSGDDVVVNALVAIGEPSVDELCEACKEHTGEREGLALAREALWRIGSEKAKQFVAELNEKDDEEE